MNNLISRFWLSLSFLFEPVQKIFNGNFWEIFENKFGKFKGKKVLDISCGTGELRRHVSPKKYLGVDINKSYIDYCNKNLGDKVTFFIASDANKFTTKEKFDVTFFVGSLHHFSDRQANRLFSSMKKYKTDKIIVLDGIPFGIFTGILKWLDAVLGGGKYFRSEETIEKMLKNYFKVVESGKLTAKNSFYFYPYWILKKQKR